jgi:hypothetical protein
MEIMKFYKKALLATAIATSFGASAASISTTNVLKLSKEGIAAKVTAGATQLSFDVIVDKNHPAASRITLSFDKAVSLGDLSTCTGPVATDPSTGNGLCGFVGTDATDASHYALQFDYGTGSFTFDNVAVQVRDDKKGLVDAISFDVNLGNPLVADSAFRVIIGSTEEAGATTATLATVLGESYVTYSSVQADLETPIEDGMGKIATEVSQFAFEVSKKFDGIIDRDDLTTFVDGSTDQSVWTFVNDETLGAALMLTSADVLYSGNFKTVTTGEVAASELAIGTGLYGSFPAYVEMSTGTSPVAVGLGQLLLDTTLEDSTKQSYTGKIDFTRPAASTDAIPVTTPTNVSVTIDASNIGVPAAEFNDVIFKDVAGGEWKIDATIINVPYYVVNHADTQSNIHMANEADEVADVIISAIDDKGNEYGPVDLGIDLAGNTVTKVKPKQIKDALGIDDTTVLKLSVTFNIDAYAQDVAAYAFSQNSQGRSEVSNSQYKVDGKIVKSKTAL